MFSVCGGKKKVAGDKNLMGTRDPLVLNSQDTIMSPYQLPSGPSHSTEVLSGREGNGFTY